MTPPAMFAKSSQITLTSLGEVFGEDTPQNRELARRVRACVNACAGFTTEDLEAGILDQMRGIIAQLAPLAAQATRAA